MIIGIISAMDSEYKNITNSLLNKKETKINGQAFIEGLINNKKIIIAKSGIGKVNAAIMTTLLISKYNPNLIINNGIAGGYNLRTKDIYIANKFTYSDFDCTPFGYQFGVVPNMPNFYYADENYTKLVKEILKANNYQFKEGLVLTADSFRTNSSQILNREAKQFATEMEGCAIAQTCYRLSTPFISLRIISDILDSDNQIENYKDFENEAAKFSTDLIINILNQM